MTKRWKWLARGGELRGPLEGDGANSEAILWEYAVLGAKSDLSIDGQLR